MIKLKPIKYGYQARNVSCGGQIVAAAFEIVGWHLRDVISTEIKPSSVMRKRVERASDREDIRREKKMRLTHLMCTIASTRE